MAQSIFVCHQVWAGRCSSRKSIGINDKNAASVGYLHTLLKRGAGAGVVRSMARVAAA
jgi:hypothetical protein